MKPRLFDDLFTPQKVIAHLFCVIMCVRKKNHIASESNSPGPLFAFRFAKLSDDSDQLSVPQMSTDPDHEGFNPVAEFFRLVSGSSDHTLPIVLQGLGEQLGVFLSDRFGINDKYLMPGVFDKLSARLTQLLGWLMFLLKQSNNFNTMLRCPVTF